LRVAWISSFMSLSRAGVKRNRLYKQVITKACREQSKCAESWSRTPNSNEQFEAPPKDWTVAILDTPAGLRGKRLKLALITGIRQSQRYVQAVETVATRFDGNRVDPVDQLHWRSLLDWWVRRR
jgi:hypothetical protein